MQFSQLAAFVAAAASMVSANSILFINQDDVQRTVKFTPAAGQAAIQSIQLLGYSQATVEFPQGWIGNAYAVSQGQEDKGFGMLAEVAFNGYNDATYYDISAIVDPTDTSNVKTMYPASDPSLASGCEQFPCDTAYWHPDDVQTKVTQEKDLVTTLGSSGLLPRDTAPEAVPRKFVLGKL